MQLKKSQKVDVDKKRGVFLRIGYAVSILVVILAFQWTTYEKIVPPDTGEDEEPEDPPTIITYQNEKKAERAKTKKVVFNAGASSFNFTEPTAVDTALFDTSFEMPQPFPYNYDEPPVPEPFEEFNVQVKPKFKGGDKALKNFLISNAQFPEKEMDLGINGRVMVSLLVNSDGSISHATIVSGSTRNYNKEALRLVKIMPDWIPGMQNGKNVPVYCTIPIVFNIMY